LPETRFKETEKNTELIIINQEGERENGNPSRGGLKRKRGENKQYHVGGKKDQKTTGYRPRQATALFQNKNVRKKGSPTQVFRDVGKRRGKKVHLSPPGKNLSSTGI